MGDGPDPDVDRARGLIDGYDGGMGAAREAQARNANDIMSTGGNVWGADTPAYARKAMQNSQLFRNNMDFGRNAAQATQNAIGFKKDGYMDIGQFYKKQLVQTGSTGQSNSQVNERQTDTPLNTTSGIVKLLM